MIQQLCTADEEVMPASVWLVYIYMHAVLSLLHFRIQAVVYIEDVDHPHFQPDVYYYTACCTQVTTRPLAK